MDENYQMTLYVILFIACCVMAFTYSSVLLGIAAAIVFMMLPSFQNKDD